MITHEEVLNILCKKITEYEQGVIIQYVQQQEKVSKLLELYQNHHYHLLQGNLQPMLRIREKIRILEEKLK